MVLDAESALQPHRLTEPLFAKIEQLEKQAEQLKLQLQLCQESKVPSSEMHEPLYMEWLSVLKDAVAAFIPMVLGILAYGAAISQHGSHKKNNKLQQASTTKPSNECPPSRLTDKDPAKHAPSEPSHLSGEGSPSKPHTALPNAFQKPDVQIQHSLVVPISKTISSRTALFEASANKAKELAHDVITNNETPNAKISEKISAAIVFEPATDCNQDVAGEGNTSTETPISKISKKISAAIVFEPSTHRPLYMLDDANTRSSEPISKKISIRDVLKSRTDSPNRGATEDRESPQTNCDRIRLPPNVEGKIPMPDLSTTHRKGFAPKKAVKIPREAREGDFASSLRGLSHSDDFAFDSSDSSQKGMLNSKIAVFSMQPALFNNFSPPPGLPPPLVPSNLPQQGSGSTQTPAEILPSAEDLVIRTCQDGLSSTSDVDQTETTLATGFAKTECAHEHEHEQRNGVIGFPSSDEGLKTEDEGKVQQLEEVPGNEAEDDDDEEGQEAILVKGSRSKVNKKQPKKLRPRPQFEKVQFDHTYEHKNLGGHAEISCDTTSQKRHLFESARALAADVFRYLGRCLQSSSVESDPSTQLKHLKVNKRDKDTTTSSGHYCLVNTLIEGVVILVGMCLIYIFLIYIFLKDAGSFQAGCAKVIPPHVIVLNSTATIPEPAGVKPNIALYSPCLLESYRSVATRFRPTGTWYWVKDEKASRVDISHRNEETQSLHTKLSDNSSIINFLTDRIFPEFGEVTQESWDWYNIQHDTGFVILLPHPLNHKTVHDAQVHWRQLMTMVSYKFRGKFFVAYTSTQDETSRKWIQNEFGIRSYPSIVVQKIPDPLATRFIYRGDFTYPDIVQFVNDVWDGCLGWKPPITNFAGLMRISERLAPKCWSQEK